MICDTGRQKSATTEGAELLVHARVLYSLFLYSFHPIYHGRFVVGLHVAVHIRVVLTEVRLCTAMWHGRKFEWRLVGIGIQQL